MNLEVYLLFGTHKSIPNLFRQYGPFCNDQTVTTPQARDDTHVRNTPVSYLFRVSA